MHVWQVWYHTWSLVRTYMLNDTLYVHTSGCYVWYIPGNSLVHDTGTYTNTTYQVHDRAVSAYFEVQHTAYWYYIFLQWLIQQKEIVRTSASSSKASAVRMPPAAHPPNRSPSSSRDHSSSILPPIASKRIDHARTHERAHAHEKTQTRKIKRENKHARKQIRGRKIKQTSTRTRKTNMKTPGRVRNPRSQRQRRTVGRKKGKEGKKREVASYDRRIHITLFFWGSWLEVCYYFSFFFPSH